MAINSIHGNSYQTFWTDRFPVILQNFIDDLWKEKKHALAFNGPIEIRPVRLSPEMNQGCIEAIYCRERNIDLTQNLSTDVRLDEYGGLHSFCLGQIPLETPEGSFILNGRERFIIAQLLHSPGLQFSKEMLTMKHRFKSQYYMVDWIVYQAKLIPTKGVWLEFELMKADPDQPFEKIPSDLLSRITNDRLRVRIRRADRFDISSLFLALGFTDVQEHDYEEDEWALPSDEMVDYGKTRRNWMEIAQCLKIEIEGLSDSEIKTKIQEKLLLENRLSPLARHQIKRRLQKLKPANLLSEEDHLTREDIKGIIEYLERLSKSDINLPLDSRRCLANKRVRLAGDLMAEEVVPRFLHNIRHRLKKRIDEAAKEGRVSEKDFIRMMEKEFRKLLETMKDSFFTLLSPLLALVPDENVLESEALKRRITLFGPGGLPSEYVKDVRDIHWSHYGRLCPVDTPQSERLGATLSIPLEARVNALGLLEIPCHKVDCQNGSFTINSNLIWLSAADEEDENPWIAYYDQKDLLQKRQDIWARNNMQECCRVKAESIKYIDAYPLQSFSLLPRLIPFMQHDDANRVLMACSSMRQTMILKEPESPLVRTPFEELFREKKPAYGRNLLLAYMPYRGLNSEDAIVVSATAAKKLAAVQHHELVVKLMEYRIWVHPSSKKKDKKVPKIVRWEITREIPRKNQGLTHLNEEGIVQNGQWVESGDVIVGVIDPHQKAAFPITMLAARSLKGETVSPWDHSLKIPPGKRGKVSSVQVLSRDKGDRLPKGVWKLVRVTLDEEKPLAIGDKLTNRHGGKGVVSAILADEDMPYFIDNQSSHDHDGIGPHTHIEIILNPLGVISRLNLGQLYETHRGWQAKKSAIAGNETIEAFTPPTAVFKEDEVKELLIDPGTGKLLERPVTVGLMHILRLHQLAGEKIQGRGYNRHAYSPLSKQPLQGKVHHGGQRLGEMEIWALQAYDARNILQEAVTVKSDNPVAREWLHQGQRRSKVTVKPVPQPPEMLRVLQLYLFCMGLDLDYCDGHGKKFGNLFDVYPEIIEKIKEVSIHPVEAAEVKQRAAGEVTDPYIGSEAEGYSDNGLFSQPIFGPLVTGMCKCGKLIYGLTGREEKCDKCGVEPISCDVRRYRLGYVELAHPVFNVMFFTVASRLLGLPRLRMKEMLTEDMKNLPLKFEDFTDTLIFFWLSVNASKVMRDRIAQRLKHQFTPENTTLTALVDFLGREKLNFINSLPGKELMEGISSIGLLHDILAWLDTDRLKELRDFVSYHLAGETNKNRRERIQKRLAVIQAFFKSGVQPVTMMFSILPVLPPGLRSQYTTPEGKTFRGELNMLYQDVISFNRNLREGKSKDKENIKLLQQKVSALIDVNKAFLPAYDRHGNRYQQCLAFFIKGKRGFFRANLLGKRVDYSGRAVIVPEPDLDLDQCGLPYEMAVALFKPLLFSAFREELSESSGTRRNVLPDFRTVEARIRKTLEHIPDSLNSTQAFKQRESDKKIITEILNGYGRCYPILMNRQPTLHRLGIQAFFFKVNPHDCVSMHPLVTAGFNADFDGDTIAIHRLVTPEALAEASRLMASNNLLSPASGSVTLNLGQDVALGIYLATKTAAGRDELGDRTGLSVGEKPLSSAEFKKFIETVVWAYQNPERSTIVDNIKTICFEHATSSGITLSIADMPDMTKARDTIMAAGGTTDIMEEMNKQVEDVLSASPENPLALIKESGARGDVRTIRQLVAMRGAMERVTEEKGQVASSYVLSSLREGMNLGEYFVSCYGSRTTLVDKKMGTAEAGYLTRQFVEMMHPMIVVEDDCLKLDDVLPALGIVISAARYEWIDVRDLNPAKASEHMIQALQGRHIEMILWDVSCIDPENPLEYQKVGRTFDDSLINLIKEDNPQKKLLGVKIWEKRTLKELQSKLYGRVLLSPVVFDGKEISSGYLVSDKDIAGQLAEYLLSDVNNCLRVRSPINCRSRHGVCAKCYGLDLSTGRLAENGCKVGIIAAQSIGEPGTQLVLRTFHHGGVMGMTGISKAIPKVQRYIHANTLAQMEANARGLGESTYPDLIDAIKHIYTANKADIADSHFELLLKAMLARLEIVYDENDVFVPGQFIRRSQWENMEPRPKVQRIISGINDLIIDPASWLSSASFGGVIDTLAHAAIGMKRDHLAGLKENTILGKLIP